MFDFFGYFVCATVHDAYRCRNVVITEVHLGRQVMILSDDVRGKDMSCENCWYYSERANECRKEPPMFENEHTFGQWPKVRVDGWCGEYAFADGGMNKDWQKYFETMLR